MIRKLPLIPTIIVLAAVATMIGLGLWQLDRKAEKEALLAHYDAAMGNPDPVVFPLGDPDPHRWLYRQSALDCRDVLSQGAMSGRNASDKAGWAMTAHCAVDGGEADIAIGWSRNPAPPEWSGGTVTGTIAPLGETVRLVVSEPQAGLEPLAKPNPAEIPNNHWAYAIQWFFFAATALVIYALALKRRLARKGQRG